MPYVAYQDVANGSKATVMKFDGSAWVNVGQAGFSDGPVGFTSLAFDGTTPYITFNDYAYNGKACVMTFNGTTWAHVGSTGVSAFSAGEAEFTSIAMNNGTPYVAYKDTGMVGLANVMKYNGNYWEEVGSGLNFLGLGTGFSEGTALYTKIAFNGNVPYVAYADASWNFGAVVKYFNGSYWQYAGSPGFSGGEAADISFTIVAGIPYISYTDYAAGNKVTVKKLVAGGWQTVGQVGFTPSTGYETSIAFNGTTPYVAFKDAANGSKVSVMKFDNCPPASSTINQTICQGSSYLFNGIPRTTAGTYVESITNASGCIETVTLNLSVNPLQMALTSGSNSVIGNLTSSNVINSSTSLIATNCNYLATLTDDASGVGAGLVNTTVNVAANNSVSTVSGQVYASRSFVINASNAEPGSITLYATQGDFNMYNSGSGSLQPMNATSVKMAKLVGGPSGIATPLPTTVVFNSGLNRYEISANVASLSGDYYLYTDPICALSMSPISLGSMVGNATNNSYNTTLAWPAVSGAQSYELRFRPFGTTTWSNTITTIPSKIIAGCQHSTTYEFQAKVRCSSSTSGLWGALGTFTTPGPIVVCPIPTGLSAVVSTTTADFSWLASASPATSYVLRWREVGTSTWSNAGCLTNSKTISGLAPGKDYEAQVSTWCVSIGAFSSYSIPYLFTTNSAPTCSTPSILTVNATGTTATLSYTAVPSATAYISRVRTVSPIGPWMNAGGINNPRTHTGLSLSTQYEAQVSTYCGATGIQSAYSSSVYFTTGAVLRPSGLSESTAASQDVNVYPNPTTSSLNVELFSKETGEVLIKLCDMSGRMIKQIQVNTFEGMNTIHVDVQDLSNGLYILMLSQNNQILGVQKVEKK